MANDLVALENSIVTQEQKFTELAKIHGAVNFKAEASFALQLLKKNDFLATTAMNNRDSLLNAVINVAAIGLTLNPAHRWAYLVPRDKQVCLDISYMGFIQLACETGNILWAHAEAVYENDQFQSHGAGLKPTHVFNPFSNDRGALIGAYCLAKTRDGEFLTTIMSIKDIHAIRNRTSSWKAGGNTPWKTDEIEMVKKTVIKRAAKTWPKVDRQDRLNMAIEAESNIDPVDFSAPNEIKNYETHDQMLALIESIPGDLTSKLLKHVEDVSKRKISSLNDFSNDEVAYSIKFLTPYANKAKAAIVPKETVVETVQELAKEVDKVEVKTTDKEWEEKNKTVRKINMPGAMSAQQVADMAAAIPWDDEPIKK